MKLLDGTPRRPEKVGNLLLGGGGFCNTVSSSPNGQVEMFGTDTFVPFIKLASERLFRQVFDYDRMPSPFHFGGDAGGYTYPTHSDGAGVYAIAAGNEVCYATNRGSLFRSGDYFRDDIQWIFGPKNMRENSGAARLWSDRMVMDDQNENIVAIGCQGADGVWYCLDTSVAEPVFTKIASLPATIKWDQYAWTQHQNMPSSVLLAVDKTSAVVDGHRQRWFACVWTGDATGGVYKTETGLAGSWTRIPGTEVGVNFPIANMVCDPWGDLWCVPAFFYENLDTPETVVMPNYVNKGARLWKIAAGTASWTEETVPYSGNGWASYSYDTANRDHRIMFDANGCFTQTYFNGSTWQWGDYQQGGTMSYHAPAIPWLESLTDGGKVVSNIKPNLGRPGEYFISHGTGVCRLWLDSQPTTSSVPLDFYDASEGLEQLVTIRGLSVPDASFFICTMDKGLWKRNNWDVFPTEHLPQQLPFVHCWDMDWAPASGGGKILVAHLAHNDNVAKHHYSLNDGASWLPFPVQPPAGAGGCIAAQDDQIIGVMGFGDESVFFTEDRGQAWAEPDLDGLTLPNWHLDPKQESGWAHARFYTKKILVASKETPGRWWMFNYGPTARAEYGYPARDDLQGVWRCDGGPLTTWTKVFGYGVNGATGRVFPHDVWWIGHTKMREVPGHANDLLICAGGDQPSGLARSLDGGVTWNPVTTNGGALVHNVNDFSFGKPLPGAPYPVIRFIGLVAGASYGVWETEDNFGACTKLYDLPGGNMDDFRAICGDRNEYGRWAYGYGGSGLRSSTKRHMLRVT